MGSGAVKLGLCLSLVTVLYEGAMAQSGCTSTLMNLSPCLNYVTGNTSVPSSTCCTRLASVVQSQPQCLCTFVSGGSSSLGLNINQTRAVGLPGVCSVSAPAASKCTGGSTPAPAAASPASSPESPPDDSSDDTPSSSTIGTTEGSGSKTVPTTVGTSDARSTRAQLHVALISAFIASWASYAVWF